jgi:deoxyribodipyrimidine photolyase-related protein
MIESFSRFTKMPYHKQKVVLIVSAMRHYAGKLKAEGWQVDYRQANSFAEGLASHLYQVRLSNVQTLVGATSVLRLSQD